MSALAIVALNQSPIRSARRGCQPGLDPGHVPIFPGKIDGIERSNVALGALVEMGSHQLCGHPLGAALSAYLALRNDGTAFGRAQGLTYLDRFTNGLASFKPAADPNYFSSELVNALNGVAGSDP